MERSQKLTNIKQSREFFEFTTDLPSILPPVSIHQNFAVCGSEIFEISPFSLKKVSKFVSTANFAAIRSDFKLLTATHSNSISISAPGRQVIKQLKAPSPPRVVCFLGLKYVACATINNELIVWDLAIAEVVFAARLEIEIFVIAPYKDEILCFGDHQIISCNIQAKEIQFGGHKRQSVSEFEQKICDFPGKAFAVEMFNDTAVIATDFGVCVASIKDKKVGLLKSIAKGVSSLFRHNDELYLGCFDGCLRKSDISFAKIEILERLKTPILCVSGFDYQQKLVIAIATNQPKVIVYSEHNINSDASERSIERNGNAYVRLQQNSQFIQFKRPEVLPNSIESLMKSHAYGKALEIALQQKASQVVINILLDVCQSSEKALASTVFYLSDENKIQLYQQLLQSFGTRDFQVLAFTVLYQLENIGLEQGVIGTWQHKILDKAKQWLEIEEILNNME